jgi:thiol:disulfide interchange protein
MLRFKIFFLLWCIFFEQQAEAQIKHPVKWRFEVNRLNATKAELVCTAVIEEGWHLYSQHLKEGGPLPTRFEFAVSSDYKLSGSVVEPAGSERMDSTFQMKVKWFEGIATFKQRMDMKATFSVIRGTVEFMVCNDHECLAPETIQFSVAVNALDATEKDSNSIDERNESDKLSITVPARELEQASQPYNIESKSLLSILIAGFMGGLLAILMPCIFPMLPFTVGYFLKTGGTSKRSVWLAIVYGLSIILIYVMVGLAITIVFGSDALNNFSTSGVFNLFFFALLLVFAASFLGAFEITLPSSWISLADARSDQPGLTGIFFMAATLALVSFSCTGPIIGTLLVEAAASGTLLGPAVGMAGFSFALALPFTAFAMFPSWLAKLPKSGGWMSTIRIVLGFLELALALKFLSNVDLAYHWQWLDREVFLVLWIIIFAILGLYLLGVVNIDKRLRGDVQISTLRLFTSIITLAFALYLVPGLWGAPLKIVSAFLPPQHTQDFDLYTAQLTKDKGLGSSEAPLDVRGARSEKKYAGLFTAPHNLDAYFDYEEGMAYASQARKPVLIDFTGHACVNCRKMEASVWPEAGVIERLRDDYVLIQLYVDDKTELAKEEQRISEYSGKKIETIGNKWSDFQAANYNTNSQPYYVLLDNEGHSLVPAIGANYDADSFAGFLENGIKAFKDGIEKN